MTDREKKLAGAVALIIVVYGGWMGFQRWNAAYAQRVQERDAAMVAVGEAQLRESRARAAHRRLEALRARSLPFDPQTATSAYRQWLIDEISRAGMSLESIRRASEPTTRADAYTTIPFKVQSEGDLTSVTRFLHAFYQRNLAHKVAQLKLSPLDDSGRLRFEADVEAIIVVGAGRPAGLPTDASDRLRLATADEYEQSIVSRNLFAAYVPPKPPRPPRPPVVRKAPAPKPDPPPFDDATRAFFTGAVGSGEAMQAWVFIRTTGEQLRLQAGDDLEVGLLKGKVLAVRPRELVYQLDNQQMVVPLGKTLRDGQPIDSDELL